MDKNDISEVRFIGVPTKIIKPGDDIFECFTEAIENNGIEIQEGDIIVVSECAVASAEGRIIRLCEVSPSTKAVELGKKYSIEPELMELIIKSSDAIVGGIPGFVLTLKDGFLCPNAGIDSSNVPEGCVALMPENPERSARELRMKIEEKTGKKVGVVIADSRTHPLRLGCVGIALACSGFRGVKDMRGKLDLFGKPLKITRSAVADNIVSGAQLVMGESDEGVPFVIVRGVDVELDDSDEPIPTVPPAECLYFGLIKSL